MSDIDVRWKNGEEWVQFPLGDIAAMPLAHACNLFSGPVQVIAKQSGSYVVNSPELQQKYRVQRKRCSTFQEILERGGDRLGKKLSEVGFV